MDDVILSRPTSCIYVLALLQVLRNPCIYFDIVRRSDSQQCREDSHQAAAYGAPQG